MNDFARGTHNTVRRFGAQEWGVATVPELYYTLCETAHTSTAARKTPSALGAMRVDDDTFTQYSQYLLGRVPGAHASQ